MNNSNIDFSQVAAAIGLILAVFVSFSMLSLRAGLRSVKRWATAQGLQVVTVKRRSFIPHWRSFSSRRFQFFAVTIRDNAGADYRACLRLESDCNDPTVLEVIWDGKEPPT